MSDNFTPLLSSTDWNDEWKQLQLERRRVDDACYWDKRSKTFSSKDAPNPYVESFLKNAALEPGESVFDMGCGTGALSIPLGLEGHPVIAADFSQGMLDKMDEEIQRLDIRSVKPKLLSWEDNWEESGVTENCVDIAFASRSIATSDMKKSLMKLHTVARRRICITLSTGSSPRMDERVLNIIGIQSIFGRDYQYAFNILVNEGINPEVSYIESIRDESYDSLDDILGHYTRMVDDVARNLTVDERNSALGKLKEWLEEHLVENTSAGKLDRKGLVQKKYRLDQPRTSIWAFLAWDKV